ncbi:ABC transporter permease [Streptomyces monticola]|uniref:ABC transporter permease n=1 Tax=Streptomyces monticola TaxID=2666263 RepID=A0ABW2JW14_9ACTN
MLRTALRNVLAHKARLIMTALAVMLGVAFVSGTLVFGDTVTSAFRGAATKSLKDVAVSVAAEYVPGSDAGEQKPGDDHRRTTVLDTRLADKISALDGVTSVRPTVGGNATLAGKDGRPVNADNSWQNLASNYAPGDDGTDARYPLQQGRGPASAGELALDAKTAEKAGYRLGDTVRFATDGPALTKKLVGVVGTDDPRVTAGGTLALFDTKTAQDLFLSPGQFDEIAVGAAAGTDENALTGKVRELLPKEGATASSGTELAAAQSEQIAENTKSLTKLLLVFAGIALFVGVFIIANTFTMLIAQRSREIALMRAVGASRRQVVRSVLIEAGLLGLIASAVGFALGLGIAAGLRPLLNAGGAGLPDGPLVIAPAALVWSLLVGVVVTVLAAWLPSRKAAKIAPVEALNSVEAPTPVRGMVVRNTIGALLTGAGVLVMFYVSTLDKGDEADLMIAMFGSFLTLTGMIVLAPLLSRPLVAVAGRVTTRLFGVSGKLAKENALRNPRRTAATASALMIGLTLITGLTVAGASADEAVKKETVQGLTADYKVTNSSYRGLDPKLTGKVSSLPGVASAAALASTGFDLRGEFGTLTGADPKRLGEVADLDFTSGSAADIGPGKVALADPVAKKAGLKTGDSFETALDFGDKKQRLTVVGTYAQNRVVGEALGSLDQVLPYAMGDKLDSILVKAEPGKAAGLEKELREALGNSPLLAVQNQEQLTKQQSGAINLMLNMMYGLLGMAVVIAVLGVINTLAMSVFERTREIGMLRAIGLDRKGVKSMVRLESVVISLFGAVLGIGTGIFLAWAGGSLTGAGLPTYETILPWARLGLFLLLALAIGVLAAIWPARRAARLNMLQSINAQ